MKGRFRLFAAEGHEAGGGREVRQPTQHTWHSMAQGGSKTPRTNACISCNHATQAPSRALTCLRVLCALTHAQDVKHACPGSLSRAFCSPPLAQPPLAHPPARALCPQLRRGCKTWGRPPLPPAPPHPRASPSSRGQTPPEKRGRTTWLDMEGRTPQHRWQEGTVERCSSCVQALLWKVGTLGMEDNGNGSPVVRQHRVAAAERC